MYLIEYIQHVPLPVSENGPLVTNNTQFPVYWAKTIAV